MHSDSAAHHEAAHAVIAVLRNLPVRRCSIIRAGASDGYTKLMESFVHHSARDLLVLVLAGGAADRKVTGEASRQDIRDLEVARMLASLLSDADETAPETDQ